QRFLSKKRSAVLCGKHRMQENFGERLGHAATVIGLPRAFNSFRVGRVFWKPMVAARTRQPWAEILNAVGVSFLPRSPATCPPASTRFAFFHLRLTVGLC